MYHRQQPSSVADVGNSRGVQEAGDKKLRQPIPAFATERDGSGEPMAGKEPRGANIQCMT